MPLNLVSGAHYIVFGTCDEECLDMDLALRNPAGVLLVADSEADDHPNVEIVAKTTGTYQLAVMMAGCRTEPCNFAIGVIQTAQ